MGGEREEERDKDPASRHATAVPVIILAADTDFSQKKEEEQDWMEKRSINRTMSPRAHLEFFFSFQKGRIIAAPSRSL